MPFSGLKNLLRLAFASLFVFLNLALSVVFISRFYPDAIPVWLVVTLIVAGFFVFVFPGIVLFRGKGPRRNSGG